MKVLWLASWYPDEYEPTNGDFIQRHAKAVSQLMYVDVIHAAQAGKDFNHLNKIVLNDDGTLHEAFHYFTYKKTGINLLDKILYNKAYLNCYKKILDQYIQEKGKPDLIHVHVPIKAGIIALKFFRKLNIPYIVSEHSSLYLKNADDNFYTRSLFFKHNTKRVFKHAALVTNVSAAIAKVLKEIFDLNDVRIIPNVVDTNHFKFIPKEKTRIFRWLHVSTMLPLKNVDKIIQTFKKISETNTDWELIICGPINDEYAQLVSDLNLQTKIKFIGEVSYEQVAIEMQKADAFIMFSKHENFPCVIIEALCCGLPVVASNVGGISETVNKTNGILVEANDTDALQNAIAFLMNNSEKFNAEKTAADAVSKYNYQTVAKQFISVYKEVVLKSSPLERI